MHSGSLNYLGSQERLLWGSDIWAAEAWREVTQGEGKFKQRPWLLKCKLTPFTDGRWSSRFELPCWRHLSLCPVRAWGSSQALKESLAVYPKRTSYLLSHLPLTMLSHLSERPLNREWEALLLAPSSPSICCVVLQKSLPLAGFSFSI